MGNVRQETEVSVGNRNRRQQTESSTPNRRQNIYTETWNEEEPVEQGSDFYTFMMQISSASFPNFEEFLNASEKKASLTGYSGKKYKVIEKLSVQGGESAVLLCQDPDGNQVVAKIFKDIERRESGNRMNLQKVIQVRKAVIDFSQSEEAKGYVLPIQDMGVVSLKPKTKNYFEIQPYCSKGDLSQRDAMSFQELIPVIKHLNEALHRIHEGRLLHLDIKPENLYEYEGNIVIGDFGIAHVQTEGRQLTVTTGGTDGYRSPETLFAPNVKDISYVLTTATDYYSLAGTLASLYVGHFIFEGIENNMALIMKDSHIPLPLSTEIEQMYLQNLLDGLFQYDSNNRFGYEDVNAWLKNHNYKGRVAGTKWGRPYNFDGKLCNDELELYQALSSNWEKGKKQLYRKYIEQFFAAFEPEIANRAYEIVEEENPDTGSEESTDIGFAKFLNFIHPEGSILWRGKQFQGLSDLADKILGRMSKKDAKEYADMLQQNILSGWMTGKAGNDSKTEKLIQKIEKLAKENPMLALYWFGHAFSNKKKTEKTVEDAIRSVLQSPKKFYETGGTLDYLLDVQRSAREYGFLYSKGFQPVIEPHFKKMEGKDRNEKAVILFQMLDEIAGKLPEGQKESIQADVRMYFKTYGPMGYLKCVQEMAQSKVYKGETAATRKLLAEISDTAITEKLSVSEMASELKKLAALVDDMVSKMQNNPFLTELGLMENKKIVCQELSGFFCYEFLGQQVPLKFQSVIEQG